MRKLVNAPVIRRSEARLDELCPFARRSRIADAEVDAPIRKSRVVALAPLVSKAAQLTRPRRIVAAPPVILISLATLVDVKTKPEIRMSRVTD